MMIRDWLLEAESRLAARSDVARTDVLELMSRALNTSRSGALGRGDETLSGDLASRLEGWLERRIAGEPVQYITGRAAFRDLDLAVTPAVLIPRPETEGLVEAVLDVLRHASGTWHVPRVLDLGTGSGAIALAIAHEHPSARVVATDASAAALEVARRNAATLGLESRVEFRAGDWFEAVGTDERFEVIVANPPYIAEYESDELPEDVRDHEPATALYSGPTGLEALREITEESPRHLVAGGLLALELAESRAREVEAWLEGAHDWSAVELQDDLAGFPRVLLARRERGPAIAPAQWEEER